MENGFLIKCKGTVIHISYIKLECVEVSKHTVFFHMIDGRKYSLTGSLQDYEDKILESPDFFRIHRSYIVNIRYIEYFDRKHVVTKFGRIMSLSRTIYPQLKEFYLGLAQENFENGAFIKEEKRKKDQKNNPLCLLMIDDEIEVIEYYKAFFRKKECEVVTAMNIEEGKVAAENGKYDCVLLDVFLNGEESFSYCEEMKKLTGAPVIFLSNLIDNEKQISGLISGGDDYITKDLDDELVWAKVQARIRIHQNYSSDIQEGDLVVSLSLKKVFIERKEVLLSSVEFDLLSFFAQHMEQVYTPQEIYENIWGTFSPENIQIVQLHMSRLCHKLEKAYPSHSFIETVWGTGYRFCPSSERKL